MTRSNRTARYYLALTAISSLLALGGCGGDDDTSGGSAGSGGSAASGATGGSAGSAGQGGGQAGTGGAGGSVATAPFTVTVSVGRTRLEGAGVALDLEDGTRIEGMTDAQGEAVLQVPEGATRESVIAHKDGYSFTAIFGSQVTDTATVGIGLTEPPDTSGRVAVTGTATNMADPANDYLSISTNNGTGFEEIGTQNYEILVDPGTPFKIMATDMAPPVFSGQDSTRTFESVVLLEQAAITAPATVDIDFSNGMSPSSTFDTSVALPADPTLSTAGVMLVNVIADVFAGGSTTCTLNGSAFDCTGNLYDVGTPVNRTMYMVVEPSFIPDGLGSQLVAFETGSPASGPVDLDFPNAPVVTSPTGNGPHPVDTPIEYSIPAGGGAYDFTIVNVFGADDRLLGVALTDGDSSIHVPALPNGSDSATHYEDDMRYVFGTCRAGATSCAAVGLKRWIASPPTGG